MQLMCTSLSLAIKYAVFNWDSIGVINWELIGAINLDFTGVINWDLIVVINWDLIGVIIGVINLWEFMARSIYQLSGLYLFFVAELHQSWQTSNWWNILLSHPQLSYHVLRHVCSASNWAHASFTKTWFAVVATPTNFSINRNYCTWKTKEKKIKKHVKIGGNGTGEVQGIKSKHKTKDAEIEKR